MEKMTLAYYREKVILSSLGRSYYTRESPQVASRLNGNDFKIPSSSSQLHRLQGLGYQEVFGSLLSPTGRRLRQGGGCGSDEDIDMLQTLPNYKASRSSLDSLLLMASVVARSYCVLEQDVRHPIAHSNVVRPAEGRSKQPP